MTRQSRPSRSGGKPSLPPAHVNIWRALQRDYRLDDPCVAPFARAFILGYGVSVGPEIIKALIGLFLVKRQDRLVATTRRLRQVISDGFRPHSFALFLGLSFGGARWLERLTLPYIQQKFAHKESDKASSSEERRQEARTLRASATFLASALAAFAALVIYQSTHRLRQRASVISPVPEVALSKKVRRNSPTLDLTLFSVVRAIDTIGRALYWQYPQKEGSFLGILGQHADVLVFWLSCWRIMWCWFYLPSRLPSSYVRWITNLSRMDVRLLRLLRQARVGDFHYGRKPTSEVYATVAGTAELMGVPVETCNPELISTLPCYVVHGKLLDSHSCERNAVQRWATAWVQSMGIYLPVHVIPRLLIGRHKFASHPLPILLAAIKAAARSSAFLATFVASIWATICLARTRLGPHLLPRVSQQFWDGGMAPMLGCMACGMSVLIENKRRRGEMALYVAPRALYAVLDEVLPGHLFEGNTGRVLARWSERLLLSISMGVITTAGAHEPALVRGVAGGVVRFMVGDAWRKHVKID